jgi:hypothetical protein
MSAQLQRFFSAHAQLLDQGRIPTLSRVYDAPLPVYLLKTAAWHVLPSRYAVLEVFWQKHRSVRAAGIGRLRACVTYESWSSDRCQADVTWFYIGEGGRRAGRTSATYHLRLAPDGPRIEVLEFQEVAFPQLHHWFADNATQLPRGYSPF